MNADGRRDATHHYIKPSTGTEKGSCQYALMPALITIDGDNDILCICSSSMPLSPRRSMSPTILLIPHNQSKTFHQYCLYYTALIATEMLSLSRSGYRWQRTPIKPASLPMMLLRRFVSAYIDDFMTQPSLVSHHYVHAAKMYRLLTI